MRSLVIAVVVWIAFGSAGWAGAASATPCSGTWWSIDSSDGSLQQVTFGENGSMFYRDDSAHSCDGVEALANDTGTVSGGTWTGTGTATLRCPADAGKTITPVFFQFTLSSDGTLTGSVGDDPWTRANPQGATR